MKSGYIYNVKPDLFPSKYEFIYYIGITGTTRDPLFLEKWNQQVAAKRGVIHRPKLDPDEKVVYNNASAFLSLLNDLGYSNWNNGIPFIIDIFGVPSDLQFNLDHLRIYGDYITEHFKIAGGAKPLLRVNHKTWSDWIGKNRTEALRLLEDFDLLLSQWGVNQPTSLLDVGKPAWWEYENGLIKNDPSRMWEYTPPAEPPVEPPEEPVEPPVVIPVEGQKKVVRYKVSLLGGLISGTVEPVYEE